MAASGAGDPREAKSKQAPFAQRIDPSRDKLSPAQLHFMRQVQLAQWQKTLPQRRARNILTGLGIGAVVLAICIRPECRFGEGARGGRAFSAFHVWMKRSCPSSGAF